MSGRNGIATLERARPEVVSVPAPTGATTVALIGHSPTSRLDANFLDQNLAVWALNDAHQFLGERRTDAWFEVHSPSVWRSTARRNGDYVSFLRSYQGPVYMQDHYPDIPTSVRYPMDEVLRHFNRDFFGSSFCYMLALALLQGFKRIEVYGCDLVGEFEYEMQRPTTCYWLGRAEGMGVEVFLPDVSPVLRSPRYGRNTSPDGIVTADEIENRGAELTKQLSQLQTQMLHAQGRRDEWAYWRNKYDEALRKGRAEKRGTS